MKRKLNQPFVLFIYGPTAVGKTEISLMIAQGIPSEVINMDVGQFYTSLSIGTAKPDWKNSAVPHHLFDIIDTPSNYSVTDYLVQLKEKINAIIARGNLPIIVGGSGFYLKSILFPLLTSKDEGLACLDKTNDNNSLWDMLYAIDPKRALQIARSDTYRIMRSLSIWNTSGKSPHETAPYFNPPADFLLLFLYRDKNQLHERINQRVFEMIADGWIQETEKLLSSPWKNFIESKKLIGYNELFHYLESNKTKTSLDETIVLIQNKTRQYAKRQATFRRKIEREIKNESLNKGKFIGCCESLNLTNTNIRLYINELLKRLRYELKYE